MTSVQLATLSTALWVAATVALFILLANWSTGGSWGLTATIVRGVQGWADRDGPAVRFASQDVEPLRPILDPYALLRRGRDQAPHPNGLVTPTSSVTQADAARAEVIDLWERRR